MKPWAALAVPIGLAIALAGDGPRRYRPRPLGDEARAESTALAARVDATLEREWEARGLVPSPEVDDLAFARRLWLDLLGTTPSLEELRALEARPAAGRRAWLIDRALADPRFASTFAEQLARIVVGADARQDDLLYRRRRLVDWLTQQVARHRSWDALVRDLLTAEGLSTDTPAVNFVVSQDRDPVKLAARTARSFLGVRIDCAQCHDHPFADWKQGDFEGLAAFFARVSTDGPAVRDADAGELELDQIAGMAMAPAMSMGAGLPAVGAAASRGPPPGKRWVAPAVPFDPALLPGQDAEDGRRRALAGWVTHPDNRYFARSIANRLWAWLMGRGVVHPVDELDLTDPWSPALLALLEAEVRAGGFDLERLVRAIVSTSAYARSSALPDGGAPERARAGLAGGTSSGSADEGSSREAGERSRRTHHTDGDDIDEDAQVAAHATFKLAPLRSDTLARALYQATSFWTYDERRALLLRFARFAQTAEFSRRHGGDPDAEELEEETLLQRLHLLNGELVTERTKDDDIFAPTTRLPLLAPTDQAAIEAAFLMTLARRPTPAEAQPWLERLAAPAGEGRDANQARAQVTSDLLWALVNTTEFVTNH